MGWFSNLLSGPSGPKTYYISWSSTVSGNLPSADFEYIVHPTREGETCFFAAFLEATDKKSAWERILQFFPNGSRSVLERADAYRKGTFEQTRRQPGVRTIRPPTK